MRQLLRAIALSIVCAGPAAAAVLVPGDLVVTDLNDELWQIHPATGSQTLVAQHADLLSPDGVALEADGNLVVVNGTASSVVRVDPSNGSTSVVTSGGSFVAPAGILVTQLGDIWVADVLTGVVKVDAGTGAQIVTYPAAAGFAPRGLTQSPTTGVVYALGNASDVWRLSGGQTTLVSSGGLMSAAQGIGSTPAGQLVVVDSTTDRVIRIDPVTGNQTEVSQGGLLVAPVGVVADPAGVLFVVDAVNGILRVDPVTGAQTEISAGGGLGSPLAIAKLPPVALQVSDRIVTDFARDEVRSLPGNDVLATPNGPKGVARDSKGTSSSPPGARSTGSMP